RASQRHSRAVHCHALRSPRQIRRATNAGWHGGSDQPGPAVRERAGADHLRGHAVRCGPVADPYRRGGRHPLGEGGRGLPAVRGRIPPGPCPRCTIVPPVYIEDGVTIHDATVGPNVSIEAGSYVTESTIANSILGRGVRVVGSTVRDSVVGDEQVIEGTIVAASVLDGGELVAAK